MKRIISMIARLAIMAMILVPAVPAGATHGTPTIASAAVTAFTGKATLAKTTGTVGFYTPISGAPCNPLCPGGDGTWTLELTGGAGGNYTANTTTPTASTLSIFTLPDPVNKLVTGTVGPGTAGLGSWCGYSRGDNGAGAIGVVTPTVFGPLPPVAILREVTWIQSAATLIQSNGLVNAGPLRGTIHSLSSAIPIPEAGGGSCTTGTQVIFQVVGVSVTLLTN